MLLRDLPVRPELDALKREAAALHAALCAGDPAALAEWRETMGREPDPAALTPDEARLLLARSYRAHDWGRLVTAVRLVEAIWRDDLGALLALVDAQPELLHEPVLLRPDSNWGPPLSYAANLGRDAMLEALHARGATDLRKAIGRAALQGHPETVRLLHRLAGSPPIEAGMLAGPAYTLNVEGTAVLFALGIRVDGPDGVDHNVMEHLLGTDSRNPAAKHRILAMYVEHGFEPPDTPIMALHRGRLDLLAAHLDRDPSLLTRTFTKAEIFPMAPACAEGPWTAQGTPLEGATLLHVAAYFDEVAIGEWLLGRGMPVDVRAARDAEGFGGYTALFGTVVSQRNFWVNYREGQPDEARFTRLLLDRGADPNARASLRARLEEGHGGGPVHEYHDVTPLGWGEQFHAPIFVSRESLRLVVERGGRR